jgi:hypothetical protein
MHFINQQDESLQIDSSGDSVILKICLQMLDMYGLSSAADFIRARDLFCFEVTT